MRLTILLFSSIIPFASGWAQIGPACVPATTQGTYAVLCTGYVSPAAGGPQVPISIIGIVTGDWAGKFTGTGKASIGGTIVDQEATGTFNLKSDCTGSITYTQKISGQPAPNLNIVAHVLNLGKEIRGMSVDPGATMTCSLKLMTR